MRPHAERTWKRVLGEALIGIGRTDEGARMLDEAQRFFESPDSKSAMSFRILHDRTALLETEGRLEEAEALAKRLADTGGPGEGDLAWHAAYMHNLGGIMLRQGRFREAEATVRKAIELRSQFETAQGREGASSRHNMASLLLRMGRVDEAIGIWQEIVAGQEECQPPNDLYLAAFRGGFGEALLRKGRPDEAQVQLDRSYAALNTLYPRGSRYAARTGEVLARLAAAQGDQAAARQYQEQVDLWLQNPDLPAGRGVSRPDWDLAPLARPGEYYGFHLHFGRTKGAGATPAFFRPAGARRYRISDSSRGSRPEPHSCRRSAAKSGRPDCSWNPYDAST